MIGAPILAGLCIAPSWSGALVALSALLLLLARQPLKIAAKDLFRRKLYPRTRWAGGFGLLEVALATGALGLAFEQSQSSLLIPLVLLLILSLIQFALEIRAQGRAILAELVGSAATAVFAALITLAGGARPELAWTLTAALAIHGWIAVVYVTRRLEHHRSTLAVVTMGIVGIAFAAYVAASGWMQWPLVAAFVLLAARACWGISPWQTKRRAQIVGFQEVGYTLMLVVGQILAAPPNS